MSLVTARSRSTRAADAARDAGARRERRPNPRPRCWRHAECASTSRPLPPAASPIRRTRIRTARSTARAPVYVVADGVGGGAMASWASRELRAQAAPRSRPAPGRAALDVERIARCRPRCRVRDGEATRRSPVRPPSRCAPRPASAVALADRVGRRLPRLSRAHVAEPRRRALVARRYLRSSRRGSSARGCPDDPARMVGDGAVDAPNVASVSWRTTRCWCFAATACTSTSSRATLRRRLRPVRRWRAVAGAWSSLRASRQQRRCDRARDSSQSPTGAV